MKGFKENFSLKGIVPPLVTPLTKNLDLDVEGLRRLIDHVIEGGVSGVFILGTTGEISRLSPTICGNGAPVPRVGGVDQSGG